MNYFGFRHGLAGPASCVGFGSWLQLWHGLAGPGTCVIASALIVMIVGKALIRRSLFVVNVLPVWRFRGSACSLHVYAAQSRPYVSLDGALFRDPRCSLAVSPLPHPKKVWSDSASSVWEFRLVWRRFIMGRRWWELSLVCGSLV